MAINRQDYQYVRNTLPSKISSISNHSANLHETVINLVDENRDWNANPTLGLRTEINKTYVFQVFNRIENTTKLSENKVGSAPCMEYLFFQPSTDWVNIRVNTDNENTKVFIFKSDLPWVVDDEGVVVGLFPSSIKKI